MTRVHGKIADNQWEYFKPRYGLHRSSTEAYKHEIEQADDQIDHFNFGVCGNNALTYSKDVYGNTTKTDIAGKMYTDDKFTNETTDFNQAAFGDIAYWATKRNLSPTTLFRGQHISTER